ncbi:hypothetical protein EPH_0063400 [Eimeria praecox]|uniref:SAG family member n=1 Tax=Eimeria praecox TaxID=51316 RepID=U6HB54_9EIME|nr:hypothetical protein EPH_0063400 [Eimeria praecox]
MLLLLIVATAAVAATLAATAADSLKAAGCEAPLAFEAFSGQATAADSLKAAGCEAPLAFEAFSGQPQEQQQGPRVQRGLSGILEGLQQLPKDWDSTAPAAVAAARGYTIGYPTAPDAPHRTKSAATAAPAAAGRDALETIKALPFITTAVMPLG